MRQYKLETRLFWAWQVEQECQWLQEMSREGWDLVSWRPMKHYYFRRTDPPAERRYHIERSRFSVHAQERQLNSRAGQGWELVAQAWGWVFYSKPA